MRNFSWQFYIFFELKCPGHRILTNNLSWYRASLEIFLISNWLRRWSCCCCNYHTCTHYGSFLGLYIQNILVLFIDITWQKAMELTMLVLLLVPIVIHVSVTKIFVWKMRYIVLFSSGYPISLPFYTKKCRWYGLTYVVHFYTCVIQKKEACTA